MPESLASYVHFYPFPDKMPNLPYLRIQEIYQERRKIQERTELEGTYN